MLFKWLIYGLGIHLVIKNYIHLVFKNNIHLVFRNYADSEMQVSCTFGEADNAKVIRYFSNISNFGGSENRDLSQMQRPGLLSHIFLFSRQTLNFYNYAFTR